MPARGHCNQNKDERRETKISGYEAIPQNKATTSINTHMWPPASPQFAVP